MSTTSTEAPSAPGGSVEAVPTVGTPGGRTAARVTGAPRRSRPGSYPETARRPRVRKVTLGATPQRRPVPADDEPEPRPLATPCTEPLPDPTAQCCSMVRAAVEVLRGERPAHHLARWVSPQVREQLVERAQLLRAAAPSAGRRATSRPVLVRRVRLLRLGDDAAEATVVLDDDGRVRAAAVRLEARRGVWRAVVLELG
ncbi:Rv3235 family protein [Isoptericola sp. BMS4]|uniref:Rv3235 family protein n=1 Tax=Isoptericola sp. BMS4 TaxID=2527875 RepID=UPI00196B125E|nr:Rv3235 family protein [Isoptericola sp. BMS4]